MTDADHIERINALTRNARNTWFMLLTALVFVGLTLMGTRPSDFYGESAQVPVPFADIDVNTSLYLLVTPILLTSAFCYFHLYIIRLSDELGEANFRLNGVPIFRAIAPWLISDAALYVRMKVRKEPIFDKRPVETVAAVFNLFVAWFLGPSVLVMSALVCVLSRNTVLALVSLIALSVCVYFGVSSAENLIQTLNKKSKGLKPQSGFWAGSCASLTIFLGGFAIFEFTTTANAPMLNLSNVDLVERPSGWLPYSLSLREAQAEWCRREAVEQCSVLTEEQQHRFFGEWKARRELEFREMNILVQLPFNSTEIFLARSFAAGYDFSNKELKNSDFSNSELEGASFFSANLESTQFLSANMAGSDFSRSNLSGALLRLGKLTNADLSGAQMEGADLSGAQMEGADLWGAQMEGADLSGAQMEGADLSGAQMEGADLSGAQMEGAVLIRAQMEGAVLSGAQMEGADLRWAQMEGADLREAQMEGADLWGAQMEGAVLSGAQMEGADLRWAQMEGADLRGAQMEGAVLSGAQMEGADLSGAQMEGADLSGAQMKGADLRGARMKGAEFNRSLLTGAKGDQISLGDTNLSAAINDGGALRFVDLRGAIFDARTDFTNAFMDATVQLPDGFAEQMGGLCQRVDRELNDEEFYGYWRGWIEADDYGWPYASSPEWENVTPIPPPEGCEWKRGPLPGSE